MRIADWRPNHELRRIDHPQIPNTENGDAKRVTYGREVAFSNIDGHVVDYGVGDICALLEGSGKGEGREPCEDDS